MSEIVVTAERGNGFEFGNNEQDSKELVTPLKFTLLGTDKEKAFLQLWLNIIGNCNDPEIQKKLRALEKNANYYRVKFTEGIVRAAQYSKGLIELDSDLKKPNSTTFWYSPIFHTGISFQVLDTLAHELLGHGFDEENGFDGKNKAAARAISNKVRDCSGKTRRGG